MSLVMLATLKPLPEHRLAVAEALKTLVAAAQLEKGMECFALFSTDDDFIIIEQWADEASWDAHVAAASSLAALEAVAGRLREPATHQRLSPVPVGGRARGAL
jgi:quinol monooxygenase YgiN